ncbi:MAG: rRNA ((2030)-N(6))-methyltransferase RlmJ [Hyphomicrobiales bacterium]|nr:rRNA ((2030)-N(6))-methyltransferase RlmJ [Hyphomicrobiales bacterium]
MNYRHAFHAGNFADVFKHIVLVRIVEYLKRKPAAFRVIDTHAGIGRYDLAGSEAASTEDWLDGIKRLLDAELPEPAAALAKPYVDIVRAENPDGGLSRYPGSPLITRHLLRKQDRLFALELHPDDAETLANQFAGDFQTRVIHLDGWLALGSQLPPKEKRGLVLIDPPFEEPGEFERLVEGLAKAHRKFATGLYALWYPLKDQRERDAFIGALQATGIPKILRAELMVRAPAHPARLFGSGMILVNPPFALESELQILLPALAKVLGDGGNGGFRLEWIRGED